MQKRFNSDIRQIITKVYSEHRFIILSVSILTIFAIMINLFIAKDRVFLVGEYVSSFDYPAHINNIITDLRSDPTQWLNFTRCIDCPILYQHNRWVALFTFLINQSGVYLGFHPFVWYIYLIITTQLVSLYLFTRVLFTKFKIIPFLVGAFVFMFYPLHYLLFVVSVDGIIKSVFILLLAEIIFFFKNIKVFSFRQTFVHAILFGLLFSFFLNGGVYYFVVVVYGIIGLCLYFYRSIFYNAAKTYIFLSIGIFITAAINFPVIFSNITDFILNGQMKEYAAYISHTPLDGLSALAKEHGMQRSSIVIFFFIIIFLFIRARLTKKHKILFIVIYGFLAWFLMGQNSSINIYDWAFSNMPFMQSMRSSYRFAFFQIVILFAIIYAGLLSFNNIKKTSTTVLYLFCIIGILSVNIHFLRNNFNYWHSVVIPQDYFQVKEYLKNNMDKKIYFPSYTPYFESMTNNYSWYDFDTRLRSVYNKPFATIFALPNMPLFEHADASLLLQELRVLTHYKNSPQDVVKALEYAGIRYVILDKNFEWEKNFPYFDIDAFVKNLSLEKQFGNISIYRLSDKSSDCKTSYGNYALGYCFSITKQASYLINKTKRDYYLEELVRKRSPLLLEKNKQVRSIPGIFNNELQEFILTNNISLPIPVYMIEQTQNNIFRKEIEKGSYILLLPVLSIDKTENIYKRTKIEITLNNTSLQQIIPEEKPYGIAWKAILIPALNEDKNIISVNTKGNGFVVIGKPLLFSAAQWEQFNRKVKNDGYNPVEIVINAD